MSHLDPKRPTSLSELRKFGLLVGGAFILMGAIGLFRHRGPTIFGAMLGLGSLLVVTGITSPSVLGPVYAGWMRLAMLVSKVTTPIFMGIIYFVLLTPIGL